MKNNFWKTSKKALSVFLSVLMIVSCWVFVPGEHNHADAALAGTATLDAAISAYESKMNGTVYTNMKAAYDAYIDALEARDAYKYGGKSTVDIATAATNLTNATNAMGTWIYSNHTEATPAFNDDTGTAYVHGTTHNNILYTESVANSQKYTYTVANLASALINPKTVLVIDGVDTPKMPVVYVGRADNGKNRYIYKLYPSNGTGVSTTYSTTESAYFSMAEAWRGQGTTADFAWIWANGGNRGGWGPNNQQQSGKINAKNWIGNGDFSYYAGVMQVKASGFTNIDTKIFIPHSSTSYATDATAVTGDESLQFYLLTGDSASDNASLTISHGIAVINYTYLQSQVKNYASSILSNIKNYTQDYADVAAMFDKIALAQTFNVSHNASGKTGANTSTAAAVAQGYNYTSFNAAVAACDTDMNALANAVNTAKSSISADSAGYSNLRSEITTAEALYVLGNMKYTAASWSAFETAYNNAQAFMAETQNKNYAENGTANTHYTTLKAAREGLKSVIDVGFNNIFSLSDWANSNAPNVSRGSATYDLSAGTITTTSWDEATGTAWVNAATGRTVAQAQDCYTSYGLSTSYSTMPVTGSTSYTLKFDATSAGQCYVFFYTASGAASTAHQSLGAASGTNTKTFTTPSDCTGIQVRFGSTGAYSKTITFSNIAIYKTEYADTIGATNYVERISFDPGASIDLPELVRNGYTFDGWFTDEACTAAASDPYTATTSTVLYAKWTKIIEWTVTFKNYDGTVLKTETVANGNDATAPVQTPAKAADANYEYEFLGWDRSFKAVTSDLVVTAQFQDVDHPADMLSIGLETAATCTQPGIISKSCDNCNYDWGTILDDTGTYPALGHSITQIVSGSSTGVDGTHTLKCIRCDETKTEAHNFQLDANQTASDATCVLPGETYYICACTQTKTEYGATNPNNHVNKYTKADTVIAATCFDEGYTGDIWCSDCNKKVADGTVVPKLEHVYTSYTYNNNETCFADGTETASCDHGCGTEDTRVVAGTKLTHVYTNYVSNGDAKCEVNGTETAYCDHGCGTKDTREDEGSARAHIFEGTIKDNKDGTHSYECTYDDCTVYGGTVACSDWAEDGANCKCSDCGYTKAHAWGTWQKHADNTSLAAGKMTHECSVCGAVEESECNYVVTNHSDATCTSPERTTYECSDCKHGYTAIGAAATGHDYTGEVKSDGKGYHNFLCNNGCNTYGYNGTQNAMTACTYKYDNEAAGTHKVYCEVCPYTFSEDCTGGNATCTDLAVCEKCDTAYGEKAAHDLTGTEKYLKKATDATCTANETYYKYCVNCEGEFSTETYEKPDSMLPHTYTGNTWYDGAELAAEAKCEVNEKYYVYCSECKASSKGTAEEATFEKEGTALEHSYYGAITCNNDGTHTINCERDGCTSTVTGSCLEAGLTYGYEPATCTEQGYTKYQCGVCNYTWEDDFVAPLGHDYTEKIYKDTHLKEAANCEHANIYWYDCSRCDKNAKDETDTDKYTVLTFTSGNVREHKWINEVAAEYLAAPATCFAAAKYYTSCEYEDCGKSSLEVLGEENATKFSHGAPLAHDWQEVKEEKYLATPSDCITDATYYYECSACKNSSKDYGNGSTWTDEGSKSGHSLTHTDASEPDCENSGRYENWYCSICEKYFKDEDATEAFKDYDATVRKALGHDWVKYAFKNATCEEDGHNAYEECSRCKVKKAGYTVYPKTGHDFTGAWTCDSVNNYHSKACLNECGASGLVIDGEQVKYAVEYDGLDYIIKGGEACVFTGEYRNYEDENGVHSHALKCVCGNETSEACEDAAPETVAPTCTEEGYTLHICDTCSYEWKTDIVAANGHDLEVNATSNNDGTHSVKCSECDYEEQRAKCSGGTATCSAKAECSVCGGEYGEKGDHVLADDKWTSNGDAKCGVNGTESQNCSACGEKVTRTEAGSALSHEMKDYGYDLSDWDGMPADFDETSIKAPTCKAEGKAITYCTREGCTYHKTKIVQKDANGHSFEGEWINVGGDCSTGITFIRECANGCGKTESKVEKVDHAWENVLVVESTCTSKGYKKQECANCGFTQTVYDSNWDENKDNLHQMSEWATLTEATCCEAEVEFRTCSICGLEETREGDQKATGEHIYDEKNPENNNLVKWIEYPATCDTAGYIEHYRDAHGNCFVKNEAGEFVKADIVIPAGHADKNTDDVCDRCSAHLNKDENGDISGSHNCLCHKTSIFMKFIYKIFRFFWKLFGINKTCACGIAHY